MKKLIIAAFTLLLATIACARPYAIAKGGAQFSNFGVDDSESLFGIRGGVGGFFPLGESSFCLMPQLIYAQKGQESGSLLEKCKIHYAEVPLTIGAFIKFTRNIGLGLMVGPYAAYGVAGEMKSEYHNEKLFDLINRFDAGISGGIQFHVWKLFVFADYDWGLKNILKKNEEYGIDDTMSTRSGSVGIGFCY